MSTLENYLIGKGLSTSTVKHYTKHTMDFLAWLDGQNIEPENVTSSDVMAYMNRLKGKGLANFTRSIHLIVLKHFFDYQISHGHRESNPTQHIKIRGSKQRHLYPILKPHELESLYQDYEVPGEDDPRKNRNWFEYYRLSRQRNKTILGLMIWQGLTTTEINHLTTKDVKLREGKIYIAGSRKSAERTLELKPQQIMELMEYQLTTRAELLKLCEEENEHYYITAPQAGQKTAKGGNALNLWKRLSQEIKKQHPEFINFKQVRTSVITHWLSQHNLRKVQYMAGHKYVSTTEGYLVNQTEDLQKDIEQFHPFG